MKVAVYTIALNEEQFIERWYESAKDADYLLIADTGSNDGTLDTAKKLGINTITVLVKPWRFDSARNAALAALPPDIDYCIALDMDEVLVPGWKDHLYTVHENGVTRPRYQYTWSWKDAEETVPGLQYGGDKIHKRFGYRWKHPVHEVIVADRIEEIQSWVGLEIHHHPDHNKSRGQYLPLLKLAVDEDPMDDRNTHYYARELFFHGQHEEAKKEFIRHLSLPRATWKAERAASMRYIAKCSTGEEVEKWFVKAAQETPDRREPLVELANYYYQTQDWNKCLMFAKKALDIKEKPLEYLCEDEAWGWLPHDLLSISAWNLGLKDLSIEQEIKALEYLPNDERLKNNLSLMLREQHGGSVTVVIPTKSNFSGLQRLLDSLENDSLICQIVVVADGEDAYKKCQNSFAKTNKVIVKKVKLEEGIHKMWNIGISHARKNNTSLALLNDDVIAGENATGILSSLLEFDKTAGLVCPDYDSRNFQSISVDVSTSCGGRYDGTGGLAGFFMVLSKDLVQEWEFDERMKWWYGDDDVIQWTLSKNRKAQIVNLAKCFGNESYTTNKKPPKNFQALIQSDKKIFESKWAKQ